MPLYEYMCRHCGCCWVIEASILESRQSYCKYCREELAQYPKGVGTSFRLNPPPEFKLVAENLKEKGVQEDVCTE